MWIFSTELEKVLITKCPIHIVVRVKTNLFLVLFFSQIKMRNDIRPAQNTMVSAVTHDMQSRAAVDSQKEINLLHQELKILRKRCKEVLIFKY